MLEKYNTINKGDIPFLKFFLPKHGYDQQKRITFCTFSVTFLELRQTSSSPPLNDESLAFCLLTRCSNTCSLMLPHFLCLIPLSPIAGPSSKSIRKSFKDSLDIAQTELLVLMPNGQRQGAVEMLLMLNIHILSDAGGRFARGRQRSVPSAALVLDQTLQPITGAKKKKQSVSVINGDICF